MATLNDMRDRIVRELQRSDLDTEITESITDAILHFQDEPLFINSKQDTLILTEGEAYYELPSDFSSELRVMLNDGNVIYQLQQVTYEQLDNMDADSNNPFQGTPSYFAFIGQKDSITTSPRGYIRLYPTPNNSTDKVLWRYFSRLNAPSGDNTGNFWTNEAGRMIRCYAKGLLFADVLMQPDQAEVNEKLAQMEYNRLVTKTEARDLTALIVSSEI